MKTKKFLSVKPATKAGKFLVMFVAGLFVASLAAYATNTTISTSLSQAVQYIQKVVLTSDGGQSGTTGVVIDGMNNKIQADNYCDLSGANCRAITSLLTSYTETDPAFMAASGNYLTSYTETDPIFAGSVAHGITGGNIVNWNTAFGRGNHASAGYLTSYTETDPLCSTFVTGNWNTAYNWVSANAVTGAFSGLNVSDAVNASSYAVAGSGGLTTSLQVILTGDVCNNLEFKSGILVATGDCI